MPNNNANFNDWTLRPKDTNLKALAVKYGKTLPITAVSLNEVQETQNLLRESHIKAMHDPNTYITSDTKMWIEPKESEAGVIEGYTVKFGSYSKSGSMLLNFSNGKSVSIDYNDIKSLNDNPATGQYLKLETTTPNITLVMEYTEVDYDYTDTLTDFYGSGVSLKTNYMLDTRYGGVETNKRRIPKITFRTLQCDASAVIGFQKGTNPFPFVGQVQGAEYFIITSYSYNILTKAWRNTFECSLGERNTVVNMKTVMGNFSITPIISGMTCEFRLNFPIQSIKFGYYALTIAGATGYNYTEAVPVNQPIRTNPLVFNDLTKVMVNFYDLRSISSNMWGDLVSQSWEDLLSQKWFTVSPTSPISATLGLQKISIFNEVTYGNIITI